MDIMIYYYYYSTTHSFIIIERKARAILGSIMLTAERYYYTCPFGSGGLLSHDSPFRGRASIAHYGIVRE